MTLSTRKFNLTSVLTSRRPELTRGPLAGERTSGRSKILHHKVLCLPHPGYDDVPPREHINGGLFSEGSLAVRGDALIHGPSFGRPTRGERMANPTPKSWKPRILANQLIDRRFGRNENDF